MSLAQVRVAGEWSSSHVGASATPMDLGGMRSRYR